ncbi:uncharacterized protein LOC125379156 [Haliotis rufescens]|uniref:uncharacterized protein LOC125379156 n=1 Tax=Haliotis rufescens TaxID=6454 RepID=UPI00201F318D|nr:uncharacterized protein LOC125379156 [Haliotis rufescens]
MLSIGLNVSLCVPGALIPCIHKPIDQSIVSLLTVDTSFLTGQRIRAPELHDKLQPIPVSEVRLCDCRRCSEMLQNCEKELSTLKDIFFIHFDPTLENVRLSESQLQFTKILSAFRNSQGGGLIVHQHNTPDSGNSLHTFLNQIFGSILTHDLVTCDVFKSQRIGFYADMFRVDVKPSEMFITCDLKTKFPSLSIDKFENGSNEKIRHLLFSSRTTESTEASLEGISSRKQVMEARRMRYPRSIHMHSYSSTPLRHMLNVLVDDINVDNIMTSHSVPEHITSLSKKKSGGSKFVAMAGHKFEDTPLHQQERIKVRLMEALKKNLRVQKNKHSKVSLQDIDVFKIGLSKDADSGGCIIEIAVGHVNGCVFYDPQGPESYKIEGGRMVRLPFERWVEEAFE